MLSADLGNELKKKLVFEKTNFFSIKLLTIINLFFPKAPLLYPLDL